jgi:hypothetical protein
LIRGEIFLKRDPAKPAPAEIFRTAIAKLARLWRDHGIRDAARDLLVYGGFTKLGHARSSSSMLRCESASKYDPRQHQRKPLIKKRI